MGEWISVDEELPEYNDKVLVWFGGHKPHAKRDRIIVAWRKDTDFLGENWSCDYDHYITHWMPLPQGPSKPVMGVV